MEVVRKSDKEFENPSKDTHYKYAFSKKVFLTDQLFLYHEQVKPGGMASAAHYHSNIDEIIYITKGELIGYDGDERVCLTAGDSICFYHNSKIKHYLKNESLKTSEFLIFRQNSRNDEVKP